MRIRKRPPAAVEATVTPVPTEKVWSAGPGDVHEVPKGHVNGSLESSRSVSEEEFIRSDPREGATSRHQSEAEHVEEEQTDIIGSKQEDLSSEGSDLLMRSLLVVFARAGSLGLTAREAVSKLVEYDLPGLQEGSHERSSVQVAKVLRTPDFVHLEGGKYYIYPGVPKAVVAESPTQSEPSQHALSQNRDYSGNIPSLNNGRRKRAASAKRATEQTCDASKVNASDLSSISALHSSEKNEFKKRRRRPPSSQHELAIGPRQCKRYDGRGWQCTRETEEGYSFCEHHQALMNKRTLRLNLAKSKGRGLTDKDVDEPMLKPVEVVSANSNQPMERPDDMENLVHHQRRRMVKARSLRSIK